MTPERAMRDFNSARHNWEAVQVNPLPMRRDPWASFRDMSFHEFAACCVVALAIVAAVLG